MKKDILNSYIIERLDSIDQGLSDFALENKPEFLHNLRVSIKKIRAVYSFTEKAYKEEYKATQLKNLFHDAGTIREIQVSITLLGTFSETPKGLINQLKKKTRVLILQFLKNYPKYKRALAKFRSDVHFPLRLPDKRNIRKFFLHERIKATKEIKIRSRKRLHQYRMRLKKIMYVYNLMPEKIQRDMDVDHLSIDRLQTKMGKWHDLHSVIELISHEDASKGNEHYLDKVKQVELKQFNALLKTLNTK